MAPTCPLMRAHCHHLANTIELGHSSVHQSPQPKRQIDRFSRFCTSHGRKSLYFTMSVPFAPKLPLLMRGSEPPSNAWFFSPPESSTQTASQLVQPCLHSSLQSVHIFYNGPPSPQSQNLPAHERMLTPSNTWYLGPMGALNPTAS